MRSMLYEHEQGVRVQPCYLSDRTVFLGALCLSLLGTRCCETLEAPYISLQDLPVLG